MSRNLRSVISHLIVVCPETTVKYRLLAVDRVVIINVQKRTYTVNRAATRSRPSPTSRHFCLMFLDRVHRLRYIARPYGRVSLWWTLSKPSARIANKLLRATRSGGQVGDYFLHTDGSKLVSLRHHDSVSFARFKLPGPGTPLCKGYQSVNDPHRKEHRRLHFYPNACSQRKAWVGRSPSP